MTCSFVIFSVFFSAVNTNSLLLFRRIISWRIWPQIHWNSVRPFSLMLSSHTPAYDSQLHSFMALSNRFAGLLPAFIKPSRVLESPYPDIPLLCRSKTYLGTGSL